MTNEAYLNKLPQIAKKQPIKLASLSKFVEGKKDSKITDYLSQVQPVASSISTKIKHNDEIMKLFPDTELPIQILTSSIISPNDMSTVNLNYIAPANLKLSQGIKSTLVSTIKDYVSSEYGLEEKLYDDVKEALFTKGANIMVVIPEAALDDIVNQPGNTSFESMVEFYNNDLNKRKSRISLKSYTMDVKVDNKTNKYSIEEMLGINVTENMSMLKLKDIKLNDLSKGSSKKYGLASMEDDDLDIFNQLFRPISEYKTLETVRINTDEHSSRKSVDKPLVLELPVEAVIPVHIKNNPDKHLGYFIALDKNGLPITSDHIDETMLSTTTDLSNSINSANGDVKLSMITRARAELYGMTKDDPKLENMNETYDKILQSYLKTIIKDGEIGDIGAISDQFDLYGVMMQRALSNQQTNLLFIPAELTSYMAFDYRDNGTGRSLLEKTSILYSLRAILFISRALANVRNYTGMSSVEVEMGDNIPNPKAVQEIVMSEFLKTRESAFPLGISRVDDIVNYIHRVGYRFNFKHPGLPDITISQNDEQASKVVPDSDFDDYLYSLILMSFGLTPEIVQSGIESDFATTFSAKSMLFAKRVMTLQSKLNNMLTDRVRKLLAYDPIIKDKLEKIVKANLKDIKKLVKTQLKNKVLDEEDMAKLKSLSDNKIIDHIVDLFIRETEVYLPRIETIEANGNKQAFEDYKTILTDTLDFIFDESKLTEEIIGPIANKLPMLKAVIGTVGINKWLNENNYLPELSQFLTKDEDGTPMFNVMGDFNTQIENLYTAFLPYLKDNKKLIDKMGEKITKIEEGPSESSDSDDDDTSDDTENEDFESTDENTDENGEETGDDSMDGGDSDEMFEGFGDPMDEDSEGDESTGSDTNLDDELMRARTRKELYMAEKHRAEALQKYEEIKQTTGLNVDNRIEKLDNMESKPEEPSGGDSGEDAFGVDEMDDLGDMGGDMDMSEEPTDDNTQEGTEEKDTKEDKEEK